MSEATVVTMGEALIDFKSTGDLAFQGYPGGSPLNVAVACARQGVPTGFLAQISRDAFGKRLVAHMAASGVDRSLLLRSDAPTTLAFVQESGGEVEFDFMANGAADVLFDPRPRPVLPAGVRWALFGSISLLQEPAASAIVETVAGFRHGRVLFDPNVRPALIPDRDAYLRQLERWVGLADVVKVSAQDLRWLAPHGEAPLREAWLTSRPSHVVITRGADGAEVWDQGGLVAQVAARPVPVVDTVGAGDAFSGSLLASLSAIDGVPVDADGWRPILARAARTAALTCGREGADPPWAADLDGAEDVRGSDA